MSSESEGTFIRLKAILQRHQDDLVISDDTPRRYCLEGPVGPATVRAWGNKVKRPLIPVAWVEIGKSGVSYHLMGIYGNSKLAKGMSKPLRMHLSGKTCFRFRGADDASMAQELEQLTVQALTAFRAAGFITKSRSAS